MVDRYTKAVLTVIAIALAGICFKLFTPAAQAQGLSCGYPSSPCYVSDFGTSPLTVEIKR